MASVIARPAVGIERLPSAVRRSVAPEQRESMNCKSCRKRKIKCNRLRPTCEACKIFQCPCLYDAVPKKRGPKTDVLESLVKRIDGLEKKLADTKKGNAENGSAQQATSPLGVKAGSVNSSSPRTETLEGRDGMSPREQQTEDGQQVLLSPVQPSPNFAAENDIMIDAYFLKVQDKPFHILDEATVRQQYRMGQLPQSLRMAIFAVGCRFTSNTNDYAAVVRLSEGYATQARAFVDVDDPTIEGLQTLLLVHRAFLAAGKGRRSYMILSMAIGMAIAMNLHREVPPKAKITPAERELRRSLFWTCYLMDRFTSCGSKRPSLISDTSMMLRLPSWIPHPGAMPTEGEYFSVQTNLQYAAGSGRFCQASSVVLIDIARILGETNRYLANGGVKGDSHFPWHALSNLSKIRAALDIWASGNQDLFTDIESLLAHPDAVVFVLAKLIYHVIHCLIYRPFLPIDLAELRGTGQHQSWQIEATNLCFLHANAIADLTHTARSYPSISWPAFSAYCIGTAGTVHVHGAHYKGHEGEVFAASPDYLSQEMQLLGELRYQWAGSQFQRDMLQRVYVAHSELVRGMGSQMGRYAPVFHLEDFFERYPGYTFDGSHVSFTDVVIEATTPPPQQQPNEGNGSQNGGNGQQMSSPATQAQQTAANTNAAIAQHMLTPLTPAISQTSHPARRYTDSAISLSTTASCDETGRMNQAAQGGEFAGYGGTISPTYTYDTLPSAGHNGGIGYDPTLFATPPPGAEGGGFGYGANHPPGITSGVPHQIQIPSQPMKTDGKAPSEQTAVTPGALSASGSRHEDEKDPFLTLLEQLAENEGRGGQTDLDFYLGETQ